MILVFGSLNVDLVVPVAQLPVAGETVLGESYRIVAGGKGANQALAARRSADASEGRRAMLEKRKPKFRGD